MILHPTQYGIPRVVWLVCLILFYQQGAEFTSQPVTDNRQSANLQPGRCEKSGSNSLLTPWSRVLPEKLERSKLLKKFPAFYGTRRFITTLTTARHLSLSSARLIQSMPPQSNLSKIQFNIILPSTPGSSTWSPSLRFPH
jgi:hypothetical protein